MNNSEPKEYSRLTRILAILLTLSLIANVIMFINRSMDFPSKTELNTENLILNKKLIQHKNELNKFRGISNKIDKIVNDAQLKIEEREKIITQLKRDKKLTEIQNKNLRIQLDSIMDRNLGLIDSLLVIRQQNSVVTETIENLEKTISELRNKVSIGGWLHGENLVISPVKISPGGTRKQTAIARKTEEINICLDIMPNKLTNPGIRNLYFVITTPDARTLYDGKNNPIIFMHPEFKKDAECTKYESFNYQNQKINICSTVEVIQHLSAGLYMVEVFAEENKLSTSVFTLR